MTDIPATKKPFRKWLWIITSSLLLILIFVFYWNFYNAYSEGDRIGKDLKISTRGNIFKTCEGYFTEGCRDYVSGPMSFTFSVADPAIEQKLLEYQLDPNACVRLRYKEFRKTLFWRGDSKYIITEAEKLP